MSFLADSRCGLSPPAIIRERRLACPEGAINQELDMLFSVFCDADIALHTSSSRMLEAPDCLRLSRMSAQESRHSWHRLTEEVPPRTATSK